MAFKCLVVDDDPLIGDLIKHFCSKTDLVEYCIAAQSANDGLSLLAANEVNLIFLDFNLPDMKGRDFLELKQNRVPVIMVTSNEEFAAKSYEYRDVKDYMIKPLSFERFQKALERVSEIENVAPVSATNDPDVIYIKDGTKLVRLSLSDVLFIRSEANYAVFVLLDSQVISLTTLKDLESKLPVNFKRVHRSFIVNANKIDYISIDEISLKGKKVPIGEKYKNVLREDIEPF